MDSNDQPTAFMTLMAAAAAAPVPLQRAGSFPASLTPTHFTNFISFTPLPSSSTRSPRKGCGPIHGAGNHPTIGLLWPHQGRCVTQSGPLKSGRENLTLLSLNQHHQEKRHFQTFVSLWHNDFILLSLRNQKHRRHQIMTHKT